MTPNGLHRMTAPSTPSLPTDFYWLFGTDDRERVAVECLTGLAAMKAPLNRIDPFATRSEAEHLADARGMTSAEFATLIATAAERWASREETTQVLAAVRHWLTDVNGPCFAVADTSILAAHLWRSQAEPSQPLGPAGVAIMFRAVLETEPGQELHVRRARNGQVLVAGEGLSNAAGAPVPAAQLLTGAGQLLNLGAALFPEDGRRRGEPGPSWPLVHTSELKSALTTPWDRAHPLARHRLSDPWLDPALAVDPTVIAPVAASLPAGSIGSLVADGSSSAAHAPAHGVVYRHDLRLSQALRFTFDRHPGLDPALTDPQAIRTLVRETFPEAHLEGLGGLDRTQLLMHAARRKAARTPYQPRRAKAPRRR